MADAEKKTSAAYVSWGTFKNALDQLSQAIPPNRIDRTVFPGMEWARQNQLFAALKFLGVINGQSKPTQELEDLTGTDEELRKEKLKQLLQRHYATLFALDLKKTTPGELAQKMGETYGMAGDTRDKAMRFFMSAAEYSGVELSPLFAAKKANGTTPPRSGQKKRGRPKAAPEQQTPLDSGSKPGTSKTVRLESGGMLTLSASLDLFSLNTKDRKFIFELIDKLEAYERESVLPPENETAGTSAE